MNPRSVLGMDGERDHRTPGNRILQANEIWTMLGIGRNTLYEWCEQGLIPHRRVGGKIDETTGERRRGRILFSEKRILEWLENRENQN